MSNASCQICHRSPMVGNNKPHSLHKTKRIVRPNLQMINGMLVCTRCQRTLTRYGFALHRAKRTAKATA